MTDELYQQHDQIRNIVRITQLSTCLNLPVTVNMLDQHEHRIALFIGNDSAGAQISFRDLQLAENILTFILSCNKLLFPSIPDTSPSAEAPLKEIKRPPGCDQSVSDPGEPYRLSALAIRLHASSVNLVKDNFVEIAQNNNPLALIIPTEHVSLARMIFEAVFVANAKIFDP